MTHPTIEKMALELCRRAGTCNPHLYEEDAKSAARALLTAEPSEMEAIELIVSMLIAQGNNGTREYLLEEIEASKNREPKAHAVALTHVFSAIKAARAAQMKEMGL